jgi:hypothetical protein
MHCHSPGRAFFGIDPRVAIGGARSLSVAGGVGHCGLHQFVYGRVRRNLEWTDQGPSDGYASIAFPQRLGRLFSPAAKRCHSSRDKKAVCRRPPLALRA